ncbi:MAG TPA: hypothetical protein DDY77_05795 [Clostridiales bacterium]|nr:hypothetical protein [Clostridiales bacterium]
MFKSVMDSFFPSLKGYRAYLTPCGGYFQGVKRIECVTETEILLSFGGFSLSVKGKKLSLGALYAGDLYIGGFITSTEAKDERR